MWREIHFAFWLPFLNLHFINFVVVTNDRKSNIYLGLSFFFPSFLKGFSFVCLIWFSSNKHIFFISANILILAFYGYLRKIYIIVSERDQNVIISNNVLFMYYVPATLFSHVRTL